MQSSTRNDNLAFTTDIQIRQVGRKHKIIHIHRGTKQEGLCSPQSDDQIGQVARVLKEQPLFSHPGSLHISQPVEHEERPAILQDACPVVGWRLRSRYVVLLGRRSVQLRTPSSIVRVEGSAEISFS